MNPHSVVSASSAPVIAALASAVISGLVAFLIARAQIRVKMRELDNRIESLRQDQLRDVLRARIDTYPTLWDHLVAHTVNWPYRKSKRDRKWAIEFIGAIDAWNAANGVFLSEASYQKFNELRACLSRIARGLPRDEVLPFEEYEKVYRIFIGDRRARRPGLATQLKNDLGSYSRAVIQRPELGFPHGWGDT
jgi:hypothetical protein